jgi:dTDP-4-dehydrorhamnose reductase
MKILLLGANGQVGGELRRSLAPLGSVVLATRAGEIDGMACERADFDHPDSLPGLIERVSPDIVVNAAAYTAVDRAEQESDAAFRANAEGPQRIAQACDERGVLLVHYSTDYVFDGASARPYREQDSPSPLGVYGASKLAGEEAVRAAAAQHLIFRTSWVYGVRGKNFLLTMLRLGAERDELRVVGDQVGSPTPAYLIADLTAEAIVRRLQPGTYHLTASGKTSWHGFAEAIMAKAVAGDLLAKAPRVLAIPTAEYPTAAKRPAYSLLDNAYLSRSLGMEIPSWELGLDSVIDDLAKLDLY